jgi:hypothetical protein
MIEKRITHSSFLDAFQEVKKCPIEVRKMRFPNNREAYNITEDIYEKDNGERRYSSFESFKDALYRRGKKRRR